MIESEYSLFTSFPMRLITNGSPQGQLTIAIRLANITDNANFPADL